jgi:hypothetical protein
MDVLLLSLWLCAASHCSSDLECQLFTPVSCLWAHIRPFHFRHISDEIHVDIIAQRQPQVALHWEGLQPLFHWLHIVYIKLGPTHTYFCTFHHLPMMYLLDEIQNTVFYCTKQSSIIHSIQWDENLGLQCIEYDNIYKFPCHCFAPHDQNSCATSLCFNCHWMTVLIRKTCICYNNYLWLFFVIIKIGLVEVVALV